MKSGMSTTIRNRTPDVIHLFGLISLRCFPVVISTTYGSVFAFFFHSPCRMQTLDIMKHARQTRCPELLEVGVCQARTQLFLTQNLYTHIWCKIKFYISKPIFLWEWKHIAFVLRHTSHSGSRGRMLGYLHMWGWGKAISYLHLGALAQRSTIRSHVC